MNKFLSDILNFNQPVRDITGKLLNERCDGVTLIQAMQLGQAIAKLGKASTELTELVYKIDEQK